MSKGGQPLGRLNNAIFNRDNSQFQGGPSHGNPQSSSAHEAQYSAFIGSSNATTMDNNMPLLPDASMIGPPPLGMEKNGWHGDFEAFHHDQTQMNQSSRQMNQWSNEFHVAPVNNAPVYAPTPFIGPRFHSSAVAVPMTGGIPMQHKAPIEPISDQQWSREFAARKQDEAQQKEKTIIAQDDSDALAKTAGALAEIIQESPNPKFQQSKFLSMMKQFRDKELAIEGDKVVQQISPEAPAQSFKTNQDIQDEILQNDIPSQIPTLASPYQAAQDFLKSKGMQQKDLPWEEDFLASSSSTAPAAASSELLGQPPRNYQHSIPIPPGTSIIPSEQIRMQQFSSDVSHDMDLSEEFQSRLVHLEGDSVAERNLYEMDTAGGRQHATNIEEAFQNQLQIDDDADKDLNMESATAQWRAWEKEYENLNRENQSPHSSVHYEYRFVTNNPYTKVSSQQLQYQQANLTESILTLEAAVQQDPSNAQKWIELGRKQQENENEASAIAALQKAIQIDPKLIDSYMAIAVSYTNENLTTLAQKALTDWLSNNPKYASIKVAHHPLATSSEVHESLINAYIEAVNLSITSNELDADVQQGLGVLFNITNDYTKAVDCFKTAVSCRPSDFELWNKLGATLANSGEGEKAMDAYFNAIQMNPRYIRARYNLAIACMQLGQYQEAAGYLLSALSIQDQSLKDVLQKTTPELMPEMRQLHTGQSDSVWNGLKLLLSSYMRREDLLAACEQRNLDAFRQDFDF